MAKFTKILKSKSVLSLLVIAVGGVIGAWAYQTFIHEPSPQVTNNSAKTTTKPDAPKVVGLESKVMFTGNSFWGRYTRDAAEKSDDKHKFPFARLAEFDRDNYDAWMTGLECPTTLEGVGMPSSQMEATLSFSCDPDYLPEFAKWFDVVTLANNHTDNMGVEGFAETKAALDKQGIQYFGHYDPDQLDDICDVVGLPARVSMSDGSSKSVKLPIAMCGYHGVFKIPSQSAIDLIAKYSEVMPVIAFPHSGAEYETGPDQIKTSLYRSMIDAGADMVLGDHPHWIQNTEVYDGKLIAYSMGNFMFDQQFNSEVMRSAAIVVDMSLNEADSQNLAKWVELGEKCISYHDDCLEQAKRDNLDRLNLSYKFSFIATSNSGYQTHPAPDLTDGVEKRLNWNQSMSQLGQSD